MRTGFNIFIMDFNSKQTSISDELRKSLGKEVFADLIDSIESIEFVKRIVSPDRGYAKDKPRDEFGKIIVDITNPHILENMNYFRAAMMVFEKNGVYTNLTPNVHPLSEYSKFWAEEARRCREGFIREEDGEWITGLNYFYWNYSPILKLVTRTDGRSVRVRRFPSIWDGDYLYFHYIEQARALGKHCNILKSRGKGFSFKGSSCLTKFFVLGDRHDPEESRREQKVYAIANEKEFLIKDGILNKYLDNLVWTSKNTPFPRHLLKESINEMHWKLGYINRETGKEEGALNEVIGVSLKNDPDKARGKRGPVILWDEMGKFPGLLKAWSVARPSVESGDFAFGTMIAGGCLTAGNKVWNNSGDLVNIEDLNTNNGIIGFNGISFEKENIINYNPPNKKECVKLTTNSGRTIECSLDHPILWSKLGYGSRPRSKNSRKYIKKTIFKDANNVNIGDQISIIDLVDIWSNKKMWNPYLVGLLVGDGSYGFNKTPVLSNCDLEVNNYIENNFNCVTEKQYTTKDKRIYKETRIKNICSHLRDLGVYGQTKNNKRLPLNIHSYCKSDVCSFLSGLFDSDGYYGKNSIDLTSSCKELLLEIQLLLNKIGIHSNVYTHKVNLILNENKKIKNINNYFNLEIKDKISILRFAENIVPLISYKKESLDNLRKVYLLRNPERSKSLPNIRFERIVKKEYTGIKPIYNLTTSTTHTYVANGIITHNTGGTDSADFRAAEEMFYNPTGYNVYGISNVFDRNANSSNLCAFFFPEYMNREDCYDVNGNSDVIKSLSQIFRARGTVKYGTSDPHALTQEKAERPICPQEAILRKEGNLFPVPDLKDYLSEIMPNFHNFIAPHYVGRIGLNTSGAPHFTLDPSTSPIRDFPLKDNLNKAGAVEIFNPPVKNFDGTVPRFRYIMGVDPVDDDYSQTTSLVSAFVFDRFLDKIVAEFTGRPRTAAEAYDTIYKLARYYNAIINYENDKKGLFAHFSNAGVVNYLCDTPSILRDKELIKETRNYGNKGKGTPSGEQINSWGRRLQADWLVSKAIGTGIPQLNDAGELVETDPIMNLHQVRSIGYIKELISWNPDGNFDRISAMGMCMLLREELRKYDVKTLVDRKKAITDDPYFSRYANKRIQPLTN